MRFKLDENLPFELADMFGESGHDAVTVLDQDLMGAMDSESCSDLHARGPNSRHVRFGFCGHPDYQPDAYPGLVVFRLDSQARDHVLEIGARLLKVLFGATLSGQLWIVEESSIRVRQ